MRLIGKRGIGSKRKTILTWKTRTVQLALALGATGLMTAIAAAAIGAHQPVSTEKAMAAAILAQQVADGTAPTPAPAPIPTQATPGGPAEVQARQAILEEAGKLETEMHSTIRHVETLRSEAYKQKDMIRLNAVTTKLDEMRQIMVIADQAFAEIRKPGQDLFVMRAKLSTIRQGWDRMRDALAAAESAEGDSMNSVTSGIGPENAESDPSKAETDPTGPGSPSSDVTALPTERPGNASPYR